MSGHPEQSHAVFPALPRPPPSPPNSYFETNEYNEGTNIQLGNIEFSAVKVVGLDPKAY